MDEYIRMLEMANQIPGLFFQDQAMLNIMIFRAVHTGRLIAKPAHLQTVVPVISHEELRARFRLHEGRPLLENRPTVIHWAGVKPWRWNPGCFSLPMDFFRSRAVRELQPVLGRWPQLALRCEEWQAQHYPSCRRRMGKLYRALKQQVGG
jgi:hypothetical protein